MFRGIFNKKRAESRGERQGRAASSVAPASAGASREAITPPAVIIDEAILALSRELSGLQHTQVPQAAKERGWASLQRELERRPVHVAATAARSSRVPRGSRRWAMGGAAAAVAIIATVLGTYSGGLLTGGTEPDTTIVTVVSSDTTDRVTTSSIDTTTVSTDIVPSTDGTQPDTTQTSGTTVDTGTTSSSITTPTTSTSNPPTTKATSPTTTGQQQNAAGQKESTARSAAAHLGDFVNTGNDSGIRSLVAPEAQALLAQMVSSLESPNGWTVDRDVTWLSDNVARVTMTVKDRVLSGQGELIEVLKRFAVRVRVDAAGAIIIAISAAS